MAEGTSHAARPFLPGTLRFGFTTCLLILFLALHLQDHATEARQQIPKPASCDPSETWFRHRRRYVYNYKVVVTSGFVGSSNVRTGSVLSCVVNVNVPKRCEATVQLSGCKLKERGLNGKLVTSPGSGQLANLLEENAVYVQIDKGLVLEQRLVVEREEPLYITNIKRGVISQLQFPILPIKDYGKPLVQHDLFGECPMHVTFDGRTNTIHTERDVYKCQLPQVFGLNLFSPSFVKQFAATVLHRPLDRMINPFQSKLDCQFKIGGKKITRSTCHHNQAFRPFTFGGEHRMSSSVNVTQSLTLVSAKRLSRKQTYVSRAMGTRHMVPLMMEMQPPHSPEVTAPQVHDGIDRLLRTYSAQSDELPPEQFHLLVQTLRGAPREVLEGVVETLLGCRVNTENCQLESYTGNLDPKMVQSLRESFFTDGLLSCGTEACVATYVTCIQRKLVFSYLGELSLFNMALFYQPEPAVLGKLLTLCQSSSSNNCWLSLGSLVNKMAERVGSSEDAELVREGKEAVLKVLQSLRVALGDSCRPGTLPPDAERGLQQKLDSLLIVLKTLGNAGGAMHLYDADQREKGKDLLSAILHCVNNPALPHKIATVALTALDKAEIKGELHTALFDLLADPTREVSLRTLAFDRLVGHDDQNTVERLAGLIRKESISSMKIYMVTKVGHLMESNDPRMKSQRQRWRESLARNALPELESLRGRGSQYAEFSEYVELPLDRSQHGARLGLRVLFEPARIVASSVTLSLSLLLHNTSVDLLEVGLDFQGLENILRAVLGPSFSLQQGLGAIIAQLMQAALPKHGTVPSLFFHDQKVVDNLRNLFLKINMPTGDAPQAQLRVKVFGSEVGFVHLEDIIKMVQSRPGGNDKGPPPAITFAQKLSEGLQLFLGKSAKLVEVVKFIPTVAGLPWKAQVHGTMVASAMLNAGGDVMKFMTRKGPLEVTGGLTTSVGVKVFFQECLHIGDITSSGIRMNVSVLVNGGLEGRLKYAPVPEQKDTPGAQVLELGIGALKRPLNIISVRSDIFQLHNGEEKALKTPDTQIGLRKCLPDFLQTWSGQKVCADGFYQKLDFSADAPFPLISGPVHIDVNARSMDKSLKEYTVTFTLTRAKQSQTPGMTVVFKASCKAPGDKLKRTFDTVVTVNPATKALSVDSVVPEFGLHYNFDLQSTYGNAGTQAGSSQHHLLSSVMSLRAHPLHSLIIETFGKRAKREAVDPKTGKALTFNMTEMEVRLNASLPGLSLEVLTNSTSGTKPGHFSQGFYARYFCKPELGMFYALHGRPDLAARNGHLSEWSVSSEGTMRGKSLAETIDSNYALAIYLPGRNVTLSNQMTGNYTWAHRDTTIFWTTEVGTANQSTDIIRMESEVTNEFEGQEYNMEYLMTLEYQDQYDVTIEGKFVGPLTDMDFNTEIVYKAKPPKKTTSRERRSLRSIYQRLKKVEKTVETAFVTAEEMVVRRGAQLTEAFLQWVSGVSGSANSTQTQPAQEESEDKNAMGMVEKPESSGQPQTGVVAGLKRLPLGPNVAYVLRFFSQPDWHLHINAHVNVKPKIEVGASKPVGYLCDWKMDVGLPDLNKDLFYFNGSLQRGKGYDLDTDFRLHSEVLNFTFDYFMQQKIARPKFYHFHRWNLVEFTKHRYDRSFAVLVDLERHDHFVYSLDLVSPANNLSHAINFSTILNKRTVRASLDLRQPHRHVHYKELSNLTPRGLKTDVRLNSTWLDLLMDMDIKFLPRGGFTVANKINSTGKTFFLNGSQQLDFDLKLDPNNRRRLPTMSLQHNHTDGVVRTAVGQLMNERLVLFTFTAQPPKGKKTRLLNWYIKLDEPTALQHSLQWEPAMTQPLFDRVLWFYTAGAHSFKVFGQTVADNVYRNVTDMVIPFTNTTISKVVNRIVQGQMQRVAQAGLDPKKNVPLSSKILKGGLKAVQDLQTYWQNSTLGQALTALGAHKVVSGAARLSTSLHYMVVQDPPFPLRQYIHFHVLPHLQRIREEQQLNFTHPLPVVWDSFLSLPKPCMLRRQLVHGIDTVFFGKKSQFPFMAVVSRDKIQTFDGTDYDISVPRKSKCTYLLTTDLVVGNHSILLTDHSTTVAMRKSSVAIDWDGTLKINRTDTIINQLPAKLDDDDATVSLKEGQITMGIPSEVRMTYDPVSQIYVIEAASHTHNRSVGLLGTNTRDAGDDFLLPSGTVAPDHHTFQQEFELSGDKSCKTGNAVTSSFGCEANSSAVCEQLFQREDSPLATCFTAISPLQFYDLCKQRVCGEIPPKKRNACPVVRTYAQLCAARDHRLDLNAQPVMDTCDGCSSGSRAVDVVFGSALDSAERSLSQLTHIIFNLASQLDDDTRFGFVHSLQDHVHAHLFDGQLFVGAKEMKSLGKLESEADSSNIGVKALLQTASNYPFRPDARHFIVLFIGEQTPDLVDAEELQELMRNRDISLVLVSDDLDPQGVLAVTWDQTVNCRGCNKNEITMPLTGMGQLAAETRGMWMSLTALEKGRRARLRKLMRPFKHVARQRSPLCADVKTKRA